MKKPISIIFSMMIIILFSSCTKSGDSTGIEGKWQAYGTLVDNEIHSFDDSFDKDVAEQLKSQNIEFKQKGVATINSALVTADGTYKKSGDSYTVQIPFDEEGNTLTLNCYFKDENLIVEQVLPDEYKDYDVGDPTVYKK